MGDIVNAGLDLVGAGPGSALKAGNKKARRAAEAANKQAQAVLDTTYGEQKNYLSPYAQQGGAAYGRMGDLLGLSGNTGVEGYGSYGPGSHFTMSNLEEDPGYQYRLAQGQRGIENSAAARGMGLSGAAIKGVTDINQKLASQEYGNAYQRYMDRYKTLGGMASTGMEASNRLADYAGAYGAKKADVFTGGGADQANSMMQAGKINADMIGQWGGAINQGLGMYNSGGWFGGGGSGNNSLAGSGYDSSTSFGQPSYNFGR